MKNRNWRFTRNKGFALAPTVIFLLVGSFLIAGILGLSNFEYRRQMLRAQWERCYQVAENGLLEGIQRVAEAENNDAVEGLLQTYGADALPFSLPADVGRFAFKIENAEDTSGVNTYKITCTAGIGNKLRTLSSTVKYHPASQVFDYCYFLNNWGWFWGGSSSYNYGDCRSNFNFDFRGNPLVNGHIWATGNIQRSGVNIDPLRENLPASGWAGTDPMRFGHQGVRRQKMPNLASISEYSKTATGTLKVGTGANALTLVSGTAPAGVYLSGTSSQPIAIDGTVAIQGDCILKGTVTGTGTLYVGGNLYIIGSVDYANGPDFTTAQSSSKTPPSVANYWTQRDNWVNTALTNGKDLIGFGAIGQILIGDPNSTTWYNNCYNNRDYGLKYIGREDQLGSDGIRGTADDNINYIDTDGDGINDYAGYDADGDGNIRTTNYSYNDELKMTTERLKNIQYYPTNYSATTAVTVTVPVYDWVQVPVERTIWRQGRWYTYTTYEWQYIQVGTREEIQYQQTRSTGDYVDWFNSDGTQKAWTPGTTLNNGSLYSFSGSNNSLASSAIGKLSGIFFTNHAVAMYSSNRSGLTVDGNIICRDEAMIYTNRLSLYQDWRAHSRYVERYFDGDGNKIIDLDLPISVSAAIIVRDEVTPQWPLS